MDALVRRRLSPERTFRAFSRLNFRRAEECATILRWLDARAGERILDIGCGDGHYDRKISKRGAEVLGIDIHERRLSAARRFHRNERTAYACMDASHLDLPEASFDKALSLCVVEHLEDDELVMRNVARVLKDGGLFVFSADSLSTPGITPEERDRHRRSYAVKTFYTVDIVEDKLARTGFDLLESRYILSTPTDLALVRLSWKLDRAPRALRVLRAPAYGALGAARRIAVLLSRDGHGSSMAGLTLLIKARKRPVTAV